MIAGVAPTTGASRLAAALAGVADDVGLDVGGPRMSGAKAPLARLLLSHDEPPFCSHHE